SGTDHIGASGLVFGFASYLIARGLFTRNIMHLALGVFVIALYGTTLLFGLAPRDGISWQGHLFGAVGGVVAAWLLDARRRGGEELRAVGDVALLVGVDAPIALDEPRQQIAVAQELEREMGGGDPERALDDHVVDRHEVDLRGPVAWLSAQPVVCLDERL